MLPEFNLCGGICAAWWHGNSLLPEFCFRLQNKSAVWTTSPLTVRTEYQKLDTCLILETGTFAHVNSDRIRIDIIHSGFTLLVIVPEDLQHRWEMIQSSRELTAGGEMRLDGASGEGPDHRSLISHC